VPALKQVVGGDRGDRGTGEGCGPPHSATVLPGAEPREMFRRRSASFRRSPSIAQRGSRRAEEGGRCGEVRGVGVVRDAGRAARWWLDSGSHPMSESAGRRRYRGTGQLLGARQARCRSPSRRIRGAGVTVRIGQTSGVASGCPWRFCAAGGHRRGRGSPRFSAARSPRRRRWGYWTAQCGALSHTRGVVGIVRESRRG
jgi:hypothetical protein